MLIDLTYRCNMGCNHCMSDCKPNGDRYDAGNPERCFGFLQKK